MAREWAIDSESRFSLGREFRVRVVQVGSWREVGVEAVIIVALRIIARQLV